ncbi:unnamed protein product (macronuclear) [Paramecium tetraurelia]|uniref:Transmembrane protein n=1 Tax=Paramecium tetraurelia TaxID=5888 RepID=A0C1L3_PARTE|nr:uncharacterized protein GSPATT00034157001 [Paramecium tetraurelia]CAK64680.1 unnamed protein product [Paramecium tetraurelia]|eukprot:XP_001432077.1 hypothetical protein (macronuclear) [Paramecium tetraurelia strain d4-2]
MKRALQQFEKTVRLTHESAKSGLNYRVQVMQNKMVLGNISIHLNKQNQIPNMLLADLFQKKHFTLTKEEQCMYFEGDFTPLNSVDQDLSYHSESGLLAYDTQKNRLKLHLTRDSSQCQGLILGYVMNQQSLYIIQKLRDSDPQCEVTVEGSYNFYLKRTLNVLIGISLLFLLDGISFNPKNDPTPVFVKNEIQYKKVQQ